MNQTIIKQLAIILNTFLSARAYFYQSIEQSIFKNSELASYQVNYALLLPGSSLNKNVETGEVGAQVQAYIDLCQVLSIYITTTPQLQKNLFYEQIQNQLNDSITQLSGFAKSLLNAQFERMIKYKVPYTMGLTEVIFNNNLPLSSYNTQVKLNYNIQDFNNILQNTEITLTV